MTTNISKITQEQLMLHMQGMINSAPVKGGSLKKSTPSTDPWADGGVMGTGGFLMEMAFEEANLLQQMGAMQTQTTTDSMTVWQKVMSETADAQKASIDKQADELQFQAIQSGISAGIMGAQGIGQAYASASNPEMNEAESHLKSLEATDKALTAQAQPKGLVAEELPGDVELLQQQEMDDAKTASATALRNLRNSDFKGPAAESTELEKLSAEDAATAKAELKDAIKTATSRYDAATNAMSNSIKKLEALGQFATQANTAIVSGYFISAIKQDEANLQAVATRDQGSTTVWQDAAKRNSDNTTQVMSNREQMLNQVMQAMREAARA